MNNYFQFGHCRTLNTAVFLAFLPRTFFCLNHRNSLSRLLTESGFNSHSKVMTVFVMQLCSFICCRTPSPPLSPLFPCSTFSLFRLQVAGFTFRVIIAEKWLTCRLEEDSGGAGSTAVCSYLFQPPLLCVFWKLICGRVNKYKTADWTSELFNKILQKVAWILPQKMETKGFGEISSHFHFRVVFEEMFWRMWKRIKNKMCLAQVWTPVGPHS